MTRASVSQLENLIAPAVHALGFELYGCEIQPFAGRSVLRVYIDSANGVTVDNCTQVSRQIGAILDVEDPLMGRYHLEVSSPGMDRLLLKKEHYQRYIGRRIRVRLKRGVEGRRNFAGVLEHIESNSITMIVDDQKVTLDLNEVDKANLVPEF